MNVKAGSMVSLQRPDGQRLEGYLATPEQPDGAPAVVVIQEWWGLNEQIRSVADRLAQSGYLALVPDLYRGEITLEQEEAQHLMEGLNFGDAASQDIGAAVAYLKQRTGKVAVMGFCMGGALALLALGQHADLSAGVVWYGLPPLEYIDASRIKVPVLGHWGTQDAFFPIKSVDALEAKFAQSGVSAQFHRYLAHHAFANETAVGHGRIPGTQFDPEWAQLAWDRTFTFLGRTLWS
ncbi:dienelactone hydrolase family protein [Dyella flagellata]|uniref:Carboxymethylenebutenolidase n=1 Tax=Dyella flagellata TaxID=1867833 RepID=A0ABQ5XAU1_9GAMM|nr:dienelactone hydrolase family protein [Dyella flagellata]GLQ88796.1 carboxymethylenebutenolidase [Dyella flagellata]